MRQYRVLYITYTTTQNYVRTYIVFMVEYNYIRVHYNGRCPVLYADILAGHIIHVDVGREVYASPKEA